MTMTSGLLAQSCGWGMHSWGGGWMWLGGAAMMAMWVAVVAGAAWLVARAVRGSTGARDARQILDERLARGEITIEEHRERSELLR